jgi:GxxExxY protein
MLLHEDLTREVMASAVEVHKALGPGLLESAYECCLAQELASRGIEARRQVALPVVYKGATLDAGYRMDLIVRDAVVVEVKAVEAPGRLHEAQLLTCLRLSKMRVGLLINFSFPILIDGVV